MANEVCSECRKAIALDIPNSNYWHHLDKTAGAHCRAFGNAKPLEVNSTLTSDPRTFPCRDCGAAALASCVDVVGHSMQGYHYSRLNQARLAVETNGGLR